jgi:hypothetical protein
LLRDAGDVGGVDLHDRAALPGIEDDALVLFPGLDFEAREPRGAEAGALAGLGEIEEVGPDVGAMAGDRQSVGQLFRQSPAEQRIGGDDQEVFTQGGAVLLNGAELELRGREGD